MQYLCRYKKHFDQILMSHNESIDLQSKEKDDLRRILSILVTFTGDKSDLRKIRTSKEGVYRKISHLLGKKDTFNNRLKIYYCFKKYFDTEMKETAVQDSHLNHIGRHIDTTTSVQLHKEDYGDTPSSHNSLQYYIPESSPLSLHNISVTPPSSSPILSSNTANLIIKPTPEKVSVPKEFLDLSLEEITHTLPLNTKNVSELPLLQNRYSYLEGTFLTESRYKDFIIKDGKLNIFYFPYYLKKMINKFANNTCIIVFKYTKYLRNDIIHIYAQCKHKHCKKFRITVCFPEVQVYSTSKNYCHKQLLTSHVRGVERSLVKRNLMTVKPSSFKKEKLLDADQSLVLVGNLQEIKSDATFRKIRSDAMAHLDRDKNHLYDLIEMQREQHSEYVKEVSIPFSVKIFSEEQIFILKAQSKGNLPVIFFDPTGSVVRKPINSLKRIFLYSAVVRVAQTERIVPIVG